MYDVISRRAAIEAVSYCGPITVREAREELMALPAIDVEPVVHARWIKTKMAGEVISLQCSHCLNHDNPSKVPGYYCWRCGARMDGDMNV